MHLGAVSISFPSANVSDGEDCRPAPGLFAGLKRIKRCDWSRTFPAEAYGRCHELVMYDISHELSRLYHPFHTESLHSLKTRNDGLTCASFFFFAAPCSGRKPPSVILKTLPLIGNLPTRISVKVANLKLGVGGSETEMAKSTTPSVVEWNLFLFCAALGYLWVCVIRRVSGELVAC